jgi:hypothetical protein
VRSLAAPIQKKLAGLGRVAVGEALERHLLEPMEGPGLSPAEPARCS